MRTAYLRQAAPKMTRAGAINPVWAGCYMGAVPEKPQAAPCIGPKAAAWGRVGFGAAALRALIPRPVYAPEEGRKI